MNRTRDDITHDIYTGATIALCVEGFCVVGIGGILLAVWGWL